MNIHNESVSPTKRSTTFRSKQKNNLQTGQPEHLRKEMPNFKVFLKEFPLDMPEDVIKTLQGFEGMHNQFLENLDNLKLYKMQLATQFELNWTEFEKTLQTALLKMKKRLDKFSQQKESQIGHLLQLNSEREKEIQAYKEKLEHIEHIRQIEKAELTIANTEVETVNKEMSDIYDILRSDMSKIMKHLNDVEESRMKEMKEGESKVYSSLDSLNVIMNSIEKEHKSTSVTLVSMREMIKAMARSTKTTTGTQVDESELETKAVDVFGNLDEKEKTLSYDTLDAVSLNTVKHGEYDHVLDKLKLKEKENPHESYNPKKNVEKPWALTPTLLVFLENMSKENEAGRVVPWEYMKSMINQIYDERIKHEQEMISGMVGNAMLLDEFVVFYFLKKYRIRRLAEVKVLEFIISLKYYSKFWVKAETFCILMDVMKFLPTFDQTDSYNYKIDYYVQNYFFQIYRLVSLFDQVENDDGVVYVETKKIKKVAKAILFFVDEIAMSRFMARLDKDNRVFEKIEHVDLDYALFLFIEEYFSARRKMSSQLGRLFSKATEKIEGFFSIDEILNIFNEFEKLYTAGQRFSQKYPVESHLQISKLYLYAISSGKNNYEISSTNFVQACQRYGFDSPFPFLHSCSKLKKDEKNEERSNTKQSEDTLNEKQKLGENTKKEESIIKIENKKEKVKTNEETNNDVKTIAYNQERVDVASKLFSQHFSILKELNDYVSIFTSTLANEKDPEVLWKSFNQIKIILQKGCSFLKYPLIDKLV